MKKNLFLLLLLLPATAIIAQEKKWLVSANADFNVPTYNKITSAGYGASANLERVYNKKISGVLTVAYDAFSTRVYDPFKMQTLHGFSVLPVLVGVKYYPGSVFYFSGQGGVVVGLKNAGRTYAVAPGFGAILPIKKEPKIDVGLRYLLTTRMPSFDENTFLNRGGYSFLTARIGYYF